jgi:hypothetical protein
MVRSLDQAAWARTKVGRGPQLTSTSGQANGRTVGEGGNRRARCDPDGA